MKRKIFCCTIVGLIILMCYPLIFLTTGSFMGEDELVEKIGMIFSPSAIKYASWALLPKEPCLWSYVKVLLDSPEFLIAFWNTIKVAGITLLLQCIVNIPAAWGLAMYRFCGKKTIFKLYIVLLILPFQVLMLPQYLILDRLALLDTTWSVILPMVFSPQFIFILFYFFKKIPPHLIDAGKIEGASEWTIFIYIGIPMAKIGLLAAAILSIIESFNIVEQPLLFLKTKSLWTLSVYLPNARMEKIGENFAAAIISILPVLLLYLYGQTYIEGEFFVEK